MNKNVSRFSWNIRVCARLIWRDMAVFRPHVWGKMVNCAIWVTITTLVFQYIGFGGTSESIGIFMACANAASTGFFEVMENVDRFIGDLQGERSITYALTLPLAQSMVFIRIALSNALQTMPFALCVLPLSKLLVWDSFSLVHFSLPKFILILVLAQLFYGFFSLWLICMVKNLEATGNIWNRVIFPLWILGCYQFSWAMLLAKSPVIAYLSLAFNPLVFATEGMRAAVMGQEGFLPFWGCCFGLIVFTILIGIIGIKRMKQRLDCL